MFFLILCRNLKNIFHKIQGLNLVKNGDFTKKTGVKKVHSYKLPMGIQETKRANGDGSQVVAYRVQMNRKNKATGEVLKVDKLFSTPREALDFLNDERKKLGLKKVVITQKKLKDKPITYNDLTPEEKEKHKNDINGEAGKEFTYNYLTNVKFYRYVQNYIDDYLNIKFRNLIHKKINKLEMTAEEKHQYKNYSNKISKLKRIVKFKVQNEFLGSLEMAFTHSFNRKNIEFGEIPLNEITHNTINSYVKTRIQDNLRASSIRAEIVLINSVIEHARHSDTNFKDYKNPIKDFNKKLYSLAIPAKDKFFRFADSQEQEKATKEDFIKAIETNKNPELIAIVKLIMMTAMRRAEVILLKWSQVYDNFIQLKDTKTNPRPVYLTAEAKALLNSIPKKPNQDRVFSYTVTGFEASLRYHLNKFGLRDITTHKLRKNSISEFVEVIGSDNSLLISEILGIRDIVGLEREIKAMPMTGLSSQTEVLKSVGHTTSAVTKRHYFSLNLKRNKK